MPTLQLWAGLLAAGCRRLLGRVWGGKHQAALPASPRPLVLQHRCCWGVLWSSSSRLKQANTQYFGGSFPSPGLHPNLLPGAVPRRKAAPVAQGAQPAGTQPPAFLGNGDDGSVRALRSAACVVTRAGSQHWGAFMCLSAFALLPHMRRSVSSMFCCRSWPALWKDVGVIHVL